MTSRDFVWRGSSAAFVLLFLVALASWSPFSVVVQSLFDINDDLAFALACPYLLKHGAQWGPDVVFTYGPLAFLSYGPLYGDHATFFLAYRAALSVVSAYLIVALIQTTRLKLADRLTALTFFLLLGYLWFIGWQEGYWTTVPFVLFVLHLRAGYERWRLLQAAMLLASVLIGTAALVKFSFTVIYFGLFALMALVDLMRRRVPWEAIVFLISMLLSWVLAGQHLANFPVWVSTSLNLSDGYSAAMAKGFYEPYKWYVVLCTYISAALLVWSAAVAPHRRSHALLLGLAAFGFAVVNIQHSFGGNQIEHSMVAMISSAAVVVMIGSRKTRYLACTSIGLAVAVLCVTNFSFRAFVEGPSRLPGSITKMVAALTGHYPDVDVSRERFFAGLRDLSRLPPDLKGTADVYTRKTGVAIAYPDLDYRPRPAFISLNAHTKQLADANAAYLNSPKAPDVLVFDSKPNERVNNRYPATDDGPSWPLIWSKYSLEGRYGDELYLYRKRAEPLPFSFSNERRFTTRVLQRIEVDSKGPVWATIDIRHNLLGAVLSKVYKAPMVYIQVFADDGSDKYYQIVPELGRAGFLLSPMILDGAGFASRSGPKVRSFLIAAEHRLEWMFKPEITVTLSDLSIESDARQ